MADWKYRQQGRDVPYVTDQEWVTLAADGSGDRGCRVVRAVTAASCRKRPLSLPHAVPPGACADANLVVALDHLDRLALAFGGGLRTHGARLCELGGRQPGAVVAPQARAVAISTGCQVSGSIERPPQPYSIMKSLGVRA